MSFCLYTIMDASELFIYKKKKKQLFFPSLVKNNLTGTVTGYQQSLNPSKSVAWRGKLSRGKRLALRWQVLVMRVQSAKNHQQ